MEQTFSVIVLTFFSYSFLGWVWETIYCSVKAKRFVYRGFLLGPITPIYGFGVSGVLYLIEPYQNNIGLLFVLATVLVTLLEYGTSFLLEKLFHARLWDYTQVPLNINGRIAIPISFFWGICCVMIVRVVNPRVEELIVNFTEHFGIFLPLILLMMISFDLGFTLANVVSFRRKLKELGIAIQEKKQQLQSSVNEIKAAASEQYNGWKDENQSLKTENNEWLESFREQPRLRSHLPKLNFSERHFLSGFPNMKQNEEKSTLEEIRLLVKELRKK
ncbi:MAG TPA: putative ABC transporter permease [Candidatus Tetragenococcus pullicola]|nr:putative ABC transporter permease [Candidatus Tetragenococcus pullicola]